MTRYRRRVVILCTCSAIGVALGIAWAGSSQAPERVKPVDRSFAVLKAPADPASIRALKDLPSFLLQPNLHKSDLRITQDNLGRFRSRILIAASEDGKTMCYALHGERPVDPAMAYCWQPGDAFAPSGLKGQHFHAVALESVIDGRVGSQLYGIAFDDVERVRVRVDGTWHAVPVVDNSFYLDLPGTPNKSVGVVEAMLEDGSVQVHDIQAGS